MLRAGDLDHRYYYYPGLVFYLLAPAVAAAGGSGPAAYLFARAVVAAFGVLSVALAFALGRRLAGDHAGLVAALLLAVSPIAVSVAHMVRPDVILGTMSLLALAAFLALDGSWRRDALAGGALGAAAAVKFTGGLLVPAYLLARTLLPGPASRRPLRLLGGVAAAGASALATFLVFTPYAVLHAPAFLSGVGVQVGHHYREEASPDVPYLEMVETYAGVVRRGLGPAALLLPGLSVLLWRDPRRWAVLSVFPVLAVAVFSTSDLKHDRFLLPAFGVLAVAAAASLEAGARWAARKAGRPGAAGMATAVAGVLLAGPPLLESVRWVRELARPGSRDRVLDWIEVHVPPGSSVLSGVPDLGLDRSRYAVLAPTGWPGLDRPLAAHARWLVTTPAQAAGLGSHEEVFRAEGRPEDGSPDLGVYAVAETSLRPLVLDPARVTASENPELAGAMLDDDPDTAWTTVGEQRPGQTIEVDLGDAVEVRRVDLEVGRRPARRGALLRVYADDGRGWSRVRVAPGRPPVEEQRAGGEGPVQVLILEPARARALRIAQEGEDAHRWSVARLTVYSR